MRWFWRLNDWLTVLGLILLGLIAYFMVAHYGLERYLPLALIIGAAALWVSVRQRSFRDRQPPTR